MMPCGTIENVYFKGGRNKMERRSTFIRDLLVKILLIAKITHAQETKGLNLSPITLKVLIVPLNPSLYVLILLKVLPRYVLKHINNTINVSIDWKLNKALYK